MKTRALPNWGLAAIIWLFWYKAFGFANKPQTLYLSCLGAPLGGSITRMHSIICLAVCMHSDLPGGLSISATLVVWWQPRQITTFSPWTWYWVKHRSQPFGSKLQGWDKSLVWCVSLPVHLAYLCQPPMWNCHISGIPRWAPLYSTLLTKKRIQDLV